MQNDFNKQNSKLNDMFQSSFPEAREEFRNNLRAEVMNKLAVSTNSQVVGSELKNIPTKITKLMSFYKKLLAGAITAVAIIALFLGVNSYLISNKAEPFAISKVSAMIDETLKNFIYVRKYNVLPGKDYVFVKENYSTKVPSIDLDLNNIEGATFEIYEHKNSDNQYFQKKVVGGTSLIYANGSTWLKNSNQKDYLNYLNSEPNGVDYLKSILNNGKTNTKITSETNNQAEITVGVTMKNDFGRIYVFTKSDYKILETKYFYANEAGQKYEYKVEKFVDWQKLDNSEFDKIFTISDNYQFISSNQSEDTKSDSGADAEKSKLLNSSSNASVQTSESNSTASYNVFNNMKAGEKCGSDGASHWNCAAGLKCDTGDSVNTGLGMIGICSASCSSTGCN